MSIKEGDVVILCSVNFVARKTVVTNVGRKNFYIKDYKTPFDINTFRAKDEYGTEWVELVDTYTKKVEVNDAHSRLSAVGVELSRTMSYDEVMEVFRSLSKFLERKKACK